MKAILLLLLLIPLALFEMFMLSMIAFAFDQPSDTMYWYERLGRIILVIVLGTIALFPVVYWVKMW